MGELSKLPNIGKEVEKQLNIVGIFTYDELKEIGTEHAWLKIDEYTHQLKLGLLVETNS